MNLIPSVLVLGAAALAAWIMTLKRSSPPRKTAQRRLASQALALAVSLQAIHFIEEAVTGFHEQLGPFFGLPPLPLGGFVMFNVLWLIIWVASIWGLAKALPAAFFAAWFMAIAGLVNGIAHPLLALSTGGYFPGLLTSPLVALACFWLWRRLLAATCWVASNPVFR